MYTFSLFNTFLMHKGINLNSKVSNTTFDPIHLNRLLQVLKRKKIANLYRKHLKDSVFRCVTDEPNIINNNQLLQTTSKDSCIFAENRSTFSA